MSANDDPDVRKPRLSFAGSVGVLVGGTAFAHGITALALPVLSRLYSPTDFSALAVFTSLLSIISVAACLRFDVAVSIPHKDADAANILALALGCALMVSFLVAVPTLLFPAQIAGWLNQARLIPNLWLLPVGVLLAASYSAIQGWFVRRKEFGQIARSRVAQSAAAAGAQISLGMSGVGVFGLLLGYVLNAGAACLVLGYRVARFERDPLRSITWAGMRAMAVEHHRFPKYSTWEALSNSAAIQVPIIMIAAMAIGPEAGYLSMAMYVMQAPMALVGGAIGQVYLSRAPAEHRADKLGAFTVEVFGGLLKAGVGPLLFVGIIAPVAFPLIFGVEWQRAGDLVAWMTPWFIMQFLASPISMALHVAGRQRAAMSLQNFSLVVRVAAVWVTAVFLPSAVSEIYALSGFFIYCVYAALVLTVVRAQPRQLLMAARSALPITSAWLLVAIVGFFVFRHFHNY
ncbi:MAG: oligosaccharide flippase family protein [Burkholderiaceae bacterium]|nr:oligosaccharide flippase family protein [Burkholderiaceae bacterium]MDZ4143676.1 oligosaccharide flippase family protein [Burkholderiales bacterium]